jgi:hypothetical protein
LGSAWASFHPARCVVYRFAGGGVDRWKVLTNYRTATTTAKMIAMHATQTTAFNAFAETAATPVEYPTI